MAALSKEFATALGLVEPSSDDKDNAPVAHEDVRAVLAADDTLSAYGIDPILIGSYKRHVSIRRVKDVDVFCRLTDLPDDVPPSELIGLFEKVLNDAYGKTSDGKKRTKKQARSIQVLFPEFDGLYVDAVPARARDDETWEIPQHEDDDWQRTNPDELTVLSSAMNQAQDEMYVPTVKLLRQTRRAQLGKTKPGGLFVELSLFNACERGLVSGVSQADYFASALSGAATLMEEHASGLLMPDPTIPGETVSVRATQEQLDKIASTFRDAAKDALVAAANLDRCAAALTFRRLLGKNGDGEMVFPLPPDCTGSSANASSLVPGDRTIPAGNRRYG